MRQGTPFGLAAPDQSKRPKGFARPKNPTKGAALVRHSTPPVTWGKDTRRTAETLDFNLPCSLTTSTLMLPNFTTAPSSTAMTTTWTHTNALTDSTLPSPMLALEKDLLAAGLLALPQHFDARLPAEPAEQSFDDLADFFGNLLQAPHLSPLPSAADDAASSHHDDGGEDDDDDADDDHDDGAAGSGRRAVRKPRRGSPNGSLPCKKGTQRGGGGRQRVNVNELYSLKKFSPELVARLEAELGDERLCLDRQAWKQFLDGSRYTEHEQECAKALRRKYCSRRYASGTRARKNEKIEHASVSNAELAQLNRQLQDENAALRAQLAAAQQQLLALQQQQHLFPLA